jgi:hypothetical protein
MPEASDGLASQVFLNWSTLLASLKTCVALSYSLNVLTEITEKKYIHKYFIFN